ELFKMTAGVDVVHVPYKGAAPAVAAMIAGDVLYMFTSAGSAQAQINNIKVYAIVDRNRSKLFPDVPTAEEAGLAGFHAPIWSGALAPAGTPRPVIETLHRAF